MTPSKAFDKQETESARAFAAFCIYRDLGANRSLNGAYRCQTGVAKTAKIKGRASGQWAEWYKTHEWERRAASWDGEQDRRRREEAAETHRLALEAYREETILRARKAARAADETLDAALAKLADPQLVKEMTPRDAAIFIRTAVSVIEQAARLEGIALGILGETGELLTTGEDF